MRPIVRVLVAAAALASVSVTASSYKTTTYYGNAWCQAPAAAFDATPVTITAVCSPSECAGTMSLGQKTRDVTCSITDVDTYAATVFGADAPFILMRTFADDACTSEARVSGRRLAVGNCFRDSATSSYRFVVRADATAQQRFFATPDCSGAMTSVADMTNGDICVARTKWSVYNIAIADLPGYRIDTYYVDQACQKPNRIVFTPHDVLADPVNPVACTVSYQGLFCSTTSGNVDPDMTAYTTYGSDAYYVLDTAYSDAGCLDDVVVTAYLTNAWCTDLVDHWMSMYIWPDRSLTQQLYSDGCGGTVTTVHLVPEVCSNSRKLTLHVAKSPAPATWEPKPLPMTSTPTPTTTSPAPMPATATTTTASPTPTPTTTTPTPTLANLKGSSTANSIALSIAAVVAVTAAVAGTVWLH